MCATEAAEAPEVVAVLNRMRKDSQTEAVHTSAVVLYVGSRYTISDKHLLLSGERSLPNKKERMSVFLSPESMSVWLVDFCYFLTCNSQRL